MKGLGQAVLGLGFMAAVAVVARAYIELGGDKADWKVVTDALIASVGVVTAILTYFALRATQDAARAALENALSVKRVERAYMSFQPPAVREIRGVKLPVVGLINMGKTPATVIAMKVKVLQGDYDRAPSFAEFWLEAVPQERAFSAGEVGPVHPIRAITGMFAVVAAAEYNDVFGDRHMTAMAIQCDRDLRFVRPLVGDDWP